MHANLISTSTLGRLSRHLSGRREHAARRRAHAEAMRIPRVATEHSTRVEYARAHGERGCRFCP